VRRRPQASALGHSAEAVRAGAELSEAGITMLGELLSPQACAELRDYFTERAVHDPYRPGSATFLPHGIERHPDAHIAHHTPLDVLLAPHLLALANSPRVLNIVARFLGCKPTIGYLAVWWSYPTGKGAQQAERFHRDVDDWRFVKLFVYLTDVGPTSGPHIYVRRSSSSKALTRIRRFEDDEVVRAFGAHNVLTMTAAAGEGFLEDTFGMHKGQPVQSGTRLIFQAVYGISPLPYSPLAPVVHRSALAVPGIDLWINRAYIA
jgi:hypothetical protein